MLRRDLYRIMARIKFVGQMCIRMGKTKMRTTLLKYFKPEKFKCRKRQCEELFETVFKVRYAGRESASFRFLFDSESH
uniref:PIPO n=1 Tax=Onion yellow dwarf virus TaxID=43130 RepID=A0A6M2YZT7_9POTV|nr:PIPO [Onion yellow dwarf virus]